MKRPILIITIGFITGIIWGLYFNIVPFLFLIMIFILLMIKVIKINLKNDFIRVINIFIKNNVILLFWVSAFISSIYLINCNKKYEYIYDKFTDKEITATIVSNENETEYKKIYKIKLEECKEINFLLRVPKSKKINLEYGDKIKISGEYILPEKSRNYGGFDYRKYLKTQEVYGIFEADNI